MARLTELAAHDSRIFLVTADLGFGVLTGFADSYPRQVLNAGVAEANMTGIATGLALDGRVVFTYSIANFPTLRCLEQLRNDAAYHDANVKVVSIGGGFSYGPLGMSHHATEDLAVLRAIPGITVTAPGCAWEAAELTATLAATPGVCYLRLDRSGLASTRRAGEQFALGKARTLRDGSDVTLVSTGGILGEALAAADILAVEGIAARVLSIHALRPFDADAILAACRETGGLITIEEHVLAGGLGSAVAESCLDAGVTPRAFQRLGAHGFAGAAGSQDYLRRCAGIDFASIVRNVRAMVSGRAHDRSQLRTVVRR
ncbi:MAG: transketolase family protein [Gemmatimonadales bacterium]